MYGNEFLEKCCNLFDINWVLKDLELVAQYTANLVMFDQFFEVVLLNSSTFLFEVFYVTVKTVYIISQFLFYYVQYTNHCVLTFGPKFPIFLIELFVFLHNSLTIPFEVFPTHLQWQQRRCFVPPSAAHYDSRAGHRGSPDGG